MSAETQSAPARNGDKARRFVAHVIALCQLDKGMAARLRRADNTATEYQSWELLAQFGIDLEWPEQRLPYALVGAAIAKAKSERNGTLPLGGALAACYAEGSGSDQAKARLRRLLACDDIDGTCRILRPVLSLINSRVAQSIDYIRLLDQLTWFKRSPERVKAQWAQEFYRRNNAEEEV